jgi:hypothetical protein
MGRHGARPSRPRIRRVALGLLRPGKELPGVVKTPRALSFAGDKAPVYP